MKKALLHTSFLVLLIFLGNQLFAQPLRIAVAANAQGLIKKLQVDFKRRTGLETEAIVGASGKLSTQIRNGAPYDLFLSADTHFPEQLYASGFGIKKPIIYAMGSLIICGSNKLDINNWQNLLQTNQIPKIAVANPKTAPYGQAAEQSLSFYKLYNRVKTKLVQGENISQVNTYLQTGAVTIGFTTKSFLYENNSKSHLKWARIDQKSYKPIAQGAILLKHAEKGKLAAANKFFDYLSSSAARKIISNSGYHLSSNSKL